VTEVVRGSSEASPEIDDHSSSFGRLRTRLVTADGTSYRDIRAGLSPRWGVVLIDALATWLALAAIVGIAIAVPGSAVVVAVVVTILAALGIGVCVHRLGLFVHEGVHNNVAPGRLNDVVTNVLGGVATVTDVRDYRPVHLAHHRYLGTDADTERTYMSRLDPGFLLRAATGVHVLAVMRRRRALADTAAGRHVAVTVAGALFHVAVVVVLALLGYWAAAVAWLIGVSAVYPVVQSTRQLLEHRHDAAVGDLTEHPENLRPFTRLFSSDPLGPVVGGAGFNRHLLHHWDPGLSYTQFRRLERWLRTTEAEHLMAPRRGTYRRTFRRLWRR
jgi:fatty acid desaturase